MPNATQVAKAVQLLEGLLVRHLRRGYHGEIEIMFVVQDGVIQNVKERTNQNRRFNEQQRVGE